jgi:hypothetical protein
MGSKVYSVAVDSTSITTTSHVTLALAQGLFKSILTYTNTAASCIMFKKCVCEIKLQTAN